MELTLSGKTKIFFIVGDPIEQVKSPTHLSRLMAERGENALVIPAHVAASDFDAFMGSARHMRNLGGLVITVPHKVAALRWADAATVRAKGIGAANILCRRPDGSWWGDHTDGSGFMDAAAAAGFAAPGKRALLVGAGGAGSAIAYEILARGAAHLALHDLDTDRRDTVIARLSARFPGKVGVGGRDPSSFNLVANASPAGMHEADPLPVDVAQLSEGQYVGDAVTEPRLTPLIANARQAGCATFTGGDMFDAQSSLLVRLLLEGGKGAGFTTGEP
ncbi:shikimate dehydrogenase family protein [Solirhodobacter olei]|uniref:shikimate dehydrogenase family protein n=1 Tax=Solirhodobacter olei TaxID=2493082 RepID=UPI000FD9B13A|nr:shikimate dehydrogenase [Solirhodobacter olei]